MYKHRCAAHLKGVRQQAAGGGGQHCQQLLEGQEGGARGKVHARRHLQRAGRAADGVTEPADERACLRAGRIGVVRPGGLNQGEAHLI